MEEIISIIENCDEFNDFVYEKLVSKYGKKMLMKQYLNY